MQPGGDPPGGVPVVARRDRRGAGHARLRPPPTPGCGRAPGTSGPAGPGPGGGRWPAAGRPVDGALGRRSPSCSSRRPGPGRRPGPRSSATRSIWPAAPHLRSVPRGRGGGLPGGIGGIESRDRLDAVEGEHLEAGQFGVPVGGQAEGHERQEAHGVGGLVGGRVRLQQHEGVGPSLQSPGDPAVTPAAYASARARCSGSRARAPVRRNGAGRCGG